MEGHREEGETMDGGEADHESSRDVIGFSLLRRPQRIPADALAEGRPGVDPHPDGRIFLRRRVGAAAGLRSAAVQVTVPVSAQARSLVPPAAL